MPRYAIAVSQGRTVWCHEQFFLIQKLCEYSTGWRKIAFCTDFRVCDYTEDIFLQIKPRNLSVSLEVSIISARAADYITRVNI